jgi:hypothetical protein
MSFFARPNLDDIQFKQLTGSTLTMSGVTNFTGILKSKGIEIDATATGATAGDALVFDGTKIILTPISGGSSGMYYGNTPASITLGGISSGTILTGKTLSLILQELLVPTLNPIIISPSISFSIILSNPYEVGTCVTPSGITTFNRGSVSPAYCGGSVYRSGLPTKYCYLDFNATYTGFTSVSLSYSHTLTQYIVQPGCRCAYGYVTYSSGCTPVYNSSGGTYLPALSAGTICSSPVTICGLYPWFWGNSVSAPTINQTLINGYACKCVASSIGSILVNNFNVSGKYIWFAIPYTSTSKTSWQGCNNPSNNGVIPGGLFPVACCMNIVSPESCWGSTCYKIYVSNYATSVNYGMAFSN